MKNWFDANKVCTNKREEIAQLIRDKFPEKNFPFPIDSTVASFPDSSKTNQLVSHLKNAHIHDYILVFQR